MASPLFPSFSFRGFLFAYVFSLSLLYSLETNLAIEGRKLGETHQIDHQHFHTIELGSLLPSDSCISTEEFDKKSSLEVVHKHGPCSNVNQDKSSAPTATEVLLRDQSRVKSIHRRLSKSRTSSSPGDMLVTDAAVTIPAKDGSAFGSGNYIVQVGLGTPTRKLSLIFDTGSDLTWTQCQPCVRSCYQQKEPIFNPSKSTSYTNISCASSLCTSLISATGNTPSCASSTCVYGVQYGDSSYSVGFFGTEKLTLTMSDVFPNFYFGCGENNNGLFGGAAGLLGLGRDKLSLISQTATKYKKLFSYCLPSTASSTGFLTFGGGSPKKPTKFTRLSSSSAVPSSFYGLDFTGISVGGNKLSISQKAFSDAGAIIDSGTVITRLPPAAYSALRIAFRQAMSKHPTAPALSILDTCYDLSAYTSGFNIPKIQLFFNGGVAVDLSASGIMYVNKPSQVCLAFAGNSDASNVAILGNVQQKTLEVVYDVAGGRVGFAPGGCR